MTIRLVSLVVLLVMDMASSCHSPSVRGDLSGDDFADSYVQTLNINNIEARCDVTTNVNGGTATFHTATITDQWIAGTTVMLSATPHATFKPAVWTGTTTTNGSNATYVMKAAGPVQLVTVCCALPDGTGC